MSGSFTCRTLALAAAALTAACELPDATTDDPGSSSGSGSGGASSSGASSSGGGSSSSGSGSSSGGGSSSSGGGSSSSGGSGSSSSGSGSSSSSSSSGSGSSSGGTACDWSDPPSNVSAWVNESWNAQLRPNLTGREAWLLDGVMKGDGQINLCIRWSGTARFTTAWRDQIAPSMEGWFNGWLRHLQGYGCFPHPQGVKVKITGIAVKPGQESLLEWSDRTIPVYTETDRNTDPPGEPKCPDACSFFANWDHEFPRCPGGAQNHFDYDVWLGDTLPGGAGAVGGDWGVRMPRATFTSGLGRKDHNIVQHEMGHGFGMQDYYDWTGSRPAGGSVMIVGTASGAPTTADGWLLRRVWKEQKAIRRW